MAFTLGAFFGQDVITMGLRAFKAAFARPLEALGRAPIGLHFRHFLLRYNLQPHQHGGRSGETSGKTVYLLFFGANTMTI